MQTNLNYTKHVTSLSLFLYLSLSLSLPKFYRSKFLIILIKSTVFTYLRNILMNEIKTLPTIISFFIFEKHSNMTLIIAWIHVCYLYLALFDLLLIFKVLKYVM